MSLTIHDTEVDIGDVERKLNATNNVISEHVLINLVTYTITFSALNGHLPNALKFIKKVNSSSTWIFLHYLSCLPDMYQTN